MTELNFVFFLVFTLLFLVMLKVMFDEDDEG